MKVAFSPIYKYRLPEGHRFPMEKYELLPEQLLLEGVITIRDLFAPSMLSEEDLLLTHTAEYWHKLSVLDLSRKEIRDIGFPVREDLIQRGRYISQGSIDCALIALEEGVALNIAGGTHHAFSNRGEGFCILNDFAITANYLISNLHVRKILILDLDVHQGNGTACIFNRTSEVFTCSVHGAKNYPLRKERSDLDIGLDDGTVDNTYLNIIDELVPKLIEDFKPEIILYLAGVDVLKSDKLGRLSLSLGGCKERDKIVFEKAKEFDVPISVSMGGGYSQSVSTIVNAHANTFKAAKETFF